VTVLGGSHQSFQLGALIGLTAIIKTHWNLSSLCSVGVRCSEVEQFEASFPVHH
jgi:hypothetical protein